MDKMKQVAKGGWHPDGERKRASSSSQSQQNNEWSDSKIKNFKGLQQVAGWTGYKPSKAAESHSNVHTRPLTTLKDPASFGAPPRRDPKAPLPPPKPRVDSSEPPLPERPAIPPRGPASPVVPPRTSTWGSSASDATSPTKPKPQLPPRASASSPTTSATNTSRTQSFPSDPGYGQSEATISATSRLGGAGISVPGFNIGRAAARKLQGRDTKTGAPIIPPSPTKMTTTAAAAASPPPPPPKPSPEFKPSSGGFNANTARETLSQSQTALKPFSSYQQGKPVSLGEVKSAASAASSIREKHGDQIAQGYRMAEKANLVQSPSNSSGNGGGSGSSAGFGGGGGAGSTVMAEGKAALQNKIANKKPPPPVPNRKPQLQGPPAVPLDSKPK